MDYEPVSVALKFAFLAVLYLFLFWIATSARRDLRRNLGGAGVEDSPFDPTGPAGGGTRDAWLIAETGEGLDPGARFDLFGGLTLGRSGEADVSFDDRYASGIHARLYSRGDRYFVEDLGSTNGTLLDGRPVSGEQELRDGSQIEIGDTRFRVEID